MPVLRGHHLVCLNFFHGEGYDKEFVRNLREVLKKIEYEKIKVTENADDVCRYCPHLRDNRCEYDEGADEEVRQMDEAALRLLNFEKDVMLEWKEVKRNIHLIFPLWYANYCYDCDWLKTCEDNQEFQRLKKEVLR